MGALFVVHIVMAQAPWDVLRCVIGYPKLLQGQKKNQGFPAALYNTGRGCLQARTHTAVQLKLKKL